MRDSAREREIDKEKRERERERESKRERERERGTAMYCVGDLVGDVLAMCG